MQFNKDCDLQLYQLSSKFQQQKRDRAFKSIMDTLSVQHSSFSTKQKSSKIVDFKRSSENLYQTAQKLEKNEDPVYKLAVKSKMIGQKKPPQISTTSYPKKQTYSLSIHNLNNGSQTSVNRNTPSMSKLYENLDNLNSRYATKRQQLSSNNQYISSVSPIKQRDFNKSGLNESVITSARNKVLNNQRNTAIQKTESQNQFIKPVNNNNFDSNPKNSVYHKRNQKSFLNSNIDIKENTVYNKNSKLKIHNFKQNFYSMLDNNQQQFSKQSDNILPSNFASTNNNNTGINNTGNNNNENSSLMLNFKKEDFHTGRFEEGDSQYKQQQEYLQQDFIESIRNSVHDNFITNTSDNLIQQLQSQKVENPEENGQIEYNSQNCGDTKQQLQQQQQQQEGSFDLEDYVFTDEKQENDDIKQQIFEQNLQQEQNNDEADLEIDQYVEKVKQVQEIQQGKEQIQGQEQIQQEQNQQQQQECEDCVNQGELSEAEELEDHNSVEEKEQEKELQSSQIEEQDNNDLVEQHSFKNDEKQGNIVENSLKQQDQNSVVFVGQKNQEELELEQEQNQQQQAESIQNDSNSIIENKSKEEQRQEKSQDQQEISDNSFDLRQNITRLEDELYRVKSRLELTQKQASIDQFELNKRINLLREENTFLKEKLQKYEEQEQ